MSPKKKIIVPIPEHIIYRPPPSIPVVMKEDITSELKARIEEIKLNPDLSQAQKRRKVAILLGLRKEKQIYKTEAERIAAQKARNQKRRDDRNAALREVGMKTPTARVPLTAEERLAKKIGKKNLKKHTRSLKDQEIAEHPELGRSMGLSEQQIENALSRFKERQRLEFKQNIQKELDRGQGLLPGF